MNFKNILDRKNKISFLSLLLVTSLSISSAAAPSNDENKKSFSPIGFYIASSQILSNGITNVLDMIKDSYLPENIDFSDFPYSDGSVESKVNIARYIREKISYIPNGIKYNYVLNRYFNGEDEFNVYYAIIHLEGKAGNNAYELAFADNTNVFDRVISRYKSNMLKSSTLYEHITAPSQYSPYGTGKNYGKGDYLNYIGFRDEETFQATIDALFVMDVIPERMHDYLDFRAVKYADDCVRLVKGGNWFRNVLQEDDIIPLEERYYYVEEEKTLDESVLKRHLG